MTDRVERLGMGLSVNTRPLSSSESWDEMLTPREAADELGVSETQMRRFCSNGMITRYGPGPDKGFRYKRADVEALQEGVDAAKDQGQTNGATPSPSIAGGEAVALLRQAHAHLETIFKQSQQPTMQVLELMRRTNEEQAERIKWLEQERTRYLDSREELISLQHERDLMAKRELAAQKRRDKGFELLMQRAPKLLDQFQTTLGGKNEKVQAAIGLLTSLEPVQLQALLASGFLSDEQAANVRRIVPELAESKPPAEAEKES